MQAPANRSIPLAAALAFVSAGPFAQEVEHEEDPERCSIETYEFCLNGVGSGVTSLDTMRIGNQGAVRRFLSEEAEEEVKGSASLGPARLTGMAAGEGALAGWTVWGSLQHQDYDSSVAVAPYDGRTTQVSGGIDRVFAERWVAGAFLGWEGTATDTTFNGGDQDRTGLTIAPYVAVALDDVFSIDAAGGYTGLNTDQTRVDNTVGSIITSEFDADRWFVTGNLNAIKVIDAWVLGARTGVLYNSERQDAYTETGGPTARSIGVRKLDLTQFYIGGDIAYSWGNWEPYGAAEYRNDLSRDDGRAAGGLPAAVGATTPDDDDEWLLGLGVRYFHDSGASASFGWLRTLGRDKFSNDTLTLIVRVPL